jgi:hypothetical protein
MSRLPMLVELFTEENYIVTEIDVNILNNIVCPTLEVDVC